MGPTQRILSLAYANSVGFSATTAMALWITSIDRLLPVPGWWGSVVGSLQLAAAAVANLIAPYLFRRLSCETLAKSSAAVACVSAWGMAASTNPWLFAAAAILLGASLGMLLSGSNALLSRSHSVQSNYATAQMFEVGFSTSFYLVVGPIIGAFGLRAVFVLLGALAFVVTLILHRLSLDSQSPRDAPGAVAVRDWRAPVAVAAFVLFFVGQAAFYQHQVAIGKMLGLDTTAMSRLMALATIGSIIGAASTKFVGLRFGIVPPLIFNPGLLAIVLIVGVSTHSALVFGVVAIMVQTLTMSLVPYVFALLARLDPTGRLPSRGPALLLIGVAGGPLLAESLIKIGGYALVGNIAALLVLGAGALFVTGARGLRWPSPTLATPEVVTPPA